MSENEGNPTEYASLRIKAATNQKIKVLSGLLDKSSLEIVGELVDEAYARTLVEAASTIESK